MSEFNREDEVMKMYQKAIGASQDGVYLTEIATPGCKPDKVNPNDVSRTAKARDDDWV